MCVCVAACYGECVSCRRRRGVNGPPTETALPTVLKLSKVAPHVDSSDDRATHSHLHRGSLADGLFSGSPAKRYQEAAASADDSPPWAL